MASTRTTRVVVRMVDSGGRWICCAKTDTHDESARAIARHGRLSVFKLMRRDLPKNSGLAILASLPICARPQFGTPSYRGSRLHDRSSPDRYRLGDVVGAGFFAMGRALSGGTIPSPSLMTYNRSADRFCRVSVPPEGQRISIRSTFFSFPKPK